MRILGPKGNGYGMCAAKRLRPGKEDFLAGVHPGVEGQSPRAVRRVLCSGVGFICMM